MPPRPSQTGIRPARRPLPTTARGPRLGALASLALHGLLLASMVIAFQHDLALNQQTHVVPVDLITIASQTNVAAAAPPAPPPPKPEIPKPEPMVAPPMPDLAQAEPAPDIAPPKINVEEPKKQDNVADLLNKLTSATPVQKTRTAPVATQSSGAASAMTSTLIDAFLSQIRNCWSPIPGAPNPADQVVEFDLRLNPSGTVAALTLRQVSPTTYGSAAAQAASRAIYQCQPYRLPPDRYSQWREINPLRFDPRQMMQQ